MLEIKTPYEHLFTRHHSFDVGHSTQREVTTNEILDCWHTRRQRCVQLLLETKDELCQDSACHAPGSATELFVFWPLLEVELL